MELTDHIQSAFKSLELLFGFPYFMKSVCPFKPGANKDFMNFTKQSLALPYVSLNLSPFSSNSDVAQPLAPS